jgi:hypothetical protein
MPVLAAENWTAPTITGASAVSGRTPAYRREFGRVVVRGAVDPGAVTVGTTITLFTLPVGYRPSQIHRWAAFSENAGVSPPYFLLTVQVAGEVQITSISSSGATTALALDAIEFSL